MRARGDEQGFDVNSLLNPLQISNPECLLPVRGEDEVSAAAARCQNVIYLFSTFCATFCDIATILRQLFANINHYISDTKDFFACLIALQLKTDFSLTMMKSNGCCCFFLLKMYIFYLYSGNLHIVNRTDSITTPSLIPAL